MEGKGQYSKKEREGMGGKEKERERGWEREREGMEGKEKEREREWKERDSREREMRRKREGEERVKSHNVIVLLSNVPNGT